MGFPFDSDGKEPTYNSGDLGSIPGLGRSPGGGHATLSSILTWSITMGKGAWWGTVQWLQGVRHKKVCKESTKSVWANKHIHTGPAHTLILSAIPPLNHFYKAPHQILLGWDTSFLKSRIPLCPPFPGKPIRLFFSISPKTLSVRFD